MSLNFIRLFQQEVWGRLVKEDPPNRTPTGHSACTGKEPSAGGTKVENGYREADKY